MKGDTLVIEQLQCTGLTSRSLKADSSALAPTIFAAERARRAAAWNRRLHHWAIELGDHPQ